MNIKLARIYIYNTCQVRLVILVSLVMLPPLFGPLHSLNRMDNNNILVHVNLYFAIQRCYITLFKHVHK